MQLAAVPLGYRQSEACARSPVVASGVDPFVRGRRSSSGRTSHVIVLILTLRVRLDARRALCAHRRQNLTIRCCVRQCSLFFLSAGRAKRPRLPRAHRCTLAAILSGLPHVIAARDPLHCRSLSLLGPPLWATAIITLISTASGPGPCRATASPLRSRKLGPLAPILLPLGSRFLLHDPGTA